MIYNYNLHDVVKVQTNTPNLSNYLTEYFLTEEESKKPDLVINVTDHKDFDVRKDGFEKHDHWFYGINGGKFVYYEDTIFGMKDKVFLKDIDGKTTITMTTGTLKIDNYIVPRSRGSISDLINIIIDLKILSAGLVTIHAACLSKNNSAIILSAFPNVGKTLCTLQLLQNGFKYLSDDTLMVDTKGKAYAHPFISTIGYYDFLRFIKPEDIGSRKYYKALLKGWAMKKSKIIERLLEPPKVDLLSIKGNEWVRSSKVEVACSLKIGDRSVRRIEKEELTRKILAINEYSMPRITKNPFLCVYAYFNDFNFEEARRKEEENIISFLDNCECFELASNDFDWISRVEEVMD